MRVWTSGWTSGREPDLSLGPCYINRDTVPAHRNPGVIVIHESVAICRNPGKALDSYRETEWEDLDQFYLHQGQGLNMIALDYASLKPLK